MNNLLYPMKVGRTLKQRLWGGNRLEQYLGLVQETHGEVYGESWEIFEGNRVINGNWAGQLLSTVSAKLGEDFLGTSSYKRYGEKLPLLTKFIFANQPLSIQVHPDDNFVKTNENVENGFGKEEAWLIVEADPGAKITWGFEQKVKLNQIRDHIEAGTLESICRYVEVSPGDVILNPPGVVHAIGAGILLFEIQQSSDLTYRLYDYNRRETDGNLRPLHIEQGLRVIDLDNDFEPKIVQKERHDGWTELVKTTNFVVQKRELRDKQNVYIPKSQKSFEIVTVIEGNVQLKLNALEVTKLSQGESVFLPARLGGYQLQGQGTILRSGVEL